MRIKFNNDETKAAASQAGQSFFARLFGRRAGRSHGAVGRRSAHRSGGFTLEEVLVSVAISALAVGGMATGYVSTAQRVEWSAHSAAAHSSALQKIEQARATKWDPQASPAVDELVSANFPVTVAALDVPTAGTKSISATNRTTITTISLNPPVKMIQVDCVWSFLSRGPFTNTVITYRSP